jgi:hypothetical protein
VPCSAWLGSLGPRCALQSSVLQAIALVELFTQALLHCQCPAMAPPVPNGDDGGSLLATQAHAGMSGFALAAQQHDFARDPPPQQSHPHAVADSGSNGGQQYQEQQAQYGNGALGLHNYHSAPLTDTVLGVAVNGANGTYVVTGDLAAAGGIRGNGAAAPLTSGSLGGAGSGGGEMSPPGRSTSAKFFGGGGTSGGGTAVSNGGGGCGGGGGVKRSGSGEPTGKLPRPSKVGAVVVQLTLRCCNMRCMLGAASSHVLQACERSVPTACLFKLPHPDHGFPAAQVEACPRCGSSDTKFCYYVSCREHCA